MAESQGPPSRRVINEPTMLRALAHPARLELLDYLGGVDSATATECASVVGLSPSATSYHLRELARIGLVREAPNEGDRRQRRWRIAADQWAIEVGPGADDDTRAAYRSLITVLRDRYERAFERYEMEGKFAESSEWNRAAGSSHTTMVLTAGELARLNERIEELLRPYLRSARRDRVPEGAREVMFEFRAFPRASR